MNNIYNIKERLLHSLLAAIEFFNHCKDEDGIIAIICFIDDFENLLDIYECSNEVTLDIEHILPYMKALLSCMQNDDIIGMADTLEYDIYPLLKEIEEGCAEK
ncbi:hypothetical protein RBG61_05100 [Paludicola sp. MB14-C6]|uniref:hypothetical protein n=1 Tax=Paludihabitans sp. MB14-C6 TaxID=3070656 RepID=UPI0027DE9AD0|nr:hypothetical protein [Paludicola sp. MB14-C6]WMJ24048.1 hypothetical protein RBG61_05100 [Paludicola sp. MB14-C6]